MRRIIYLILAIIIISILFLFVVLPYVVAYASYLSGMKSFSPGADVVFSGKLYYDFYYNITLESIVHYEFNINIKYYSDNDIQAKLDLYAENTSAHLATVIVNITKDSDLIKFLFPTSTELNMTSLNYSVKICERPGNIRFAIGGLPSNIGVPRNHAAILEHGNFSLVAVNWGACKPYSGERADIFYNYVKIENGYMLASLYYDIEDITFNNIDGFREFAKQPLIASLLIETFKIKILNDTIEAFNKKLSEITIRPGTADIIENIYLNSSNVFPVEQAWLDAMFGTYMTLTPISQILTIAAIILLVLYIRRG